MDRRKEMYDKVDKTCLMAPRVNHHHKTHTSNKKTTKTKAHIEPK